MRASEVAQAIGSLETQVKCLCEHIDKADLTHEERHNVICTRLGDVEASNQFNKGRMAYVGWVASIAVLAITAAIGALLNKVIGDLS